MLIIAYLIGLFSYSILLLGIFGQLYYISLLLLSIVFSILVGVLLFPKYSTIGKFLKNSKKSELLLLFIFGLLIFTNIIGASGPELAFDALWYHLTIPKLYLLNHKIYFIQGNLLYYNAMPKLTEMLYTAALAVGNEIWAKFIHFSFGVLVSITLYKLARIYLNKFWSLVTILLFYSNLVVGWLSITAYADLGRAFFETLALFYFLRYVKEKNHRYIIHSALLLGLAISTKVISLISIPIFVLLIILLEKSWGSRLRRALLFCVMTIAVPMPWFLLSFLSTNNPIYPLFSSAVPAFSLANLNPGNVIGNLVKVFLFSPDPVNPLYVLFLPVILVVFKKIRKKYKSLISFIILSLIFWYFATFLGFWYGTEEAGSARFLTTYLPAYSLLCVAAITSVKYRKLQVMGIALILVVVFVNGSYRLAANLRYIPFILGLESKDQFLMNNLNFSFGDFYDENSDIKRIVGENIVEIVNVHNLFYVDFPFTLQEFKNKKKPSYILVQHGKLPQGYRFSSIVYQNKKTGVILYKL